MSRSIESLIARQFEAFDQTQDPVTIAEVVDSDRPLVDATVAPPDSIGVGSRIGLAAAVIAVLAFTLLLAWYTSAVPLLDPADNDIVPQPTTPDTLSAPEPTLPPDTTTPTTTTDDHEMAVDEATLDMLRSYIETRWSGDIDAAMALVADPDLLNDFDARFARLQYWLVGVGWYGWLFYTPAEGFPNHEVPG